VLQFRVVTPDSVLRVANACQHVDLFFALRGGGGGTFGVVLDATVRVAPRLPLRVVFLQWNNTQVEHAAPLTRELFEILIDNGLKVGASPLYRA
jgi:FAD/FMN-containing dehydrogenase